MEKFIHIEAGVEPPLHIDMVWAWLKDSRIVAVRTSTIPVQFDGFNCYRVGANGMLEIPGRLPQQSLGVHHGSTSPV